MLISIVIPCYNEEKNINRTLDGLIELFSRETHGYEIIAVDDGSKDKTWEVIKEYSAKHSQIKGIRHMTNFGQSAAYMAGFDHAKGDYVVTVSADLEIPLENISKVLKYLDEGYDFVNTNRIGRWGGQSSTKNTKSDLANKIIAKISKVSMKDRGSGMKGFRRVLIDNLRLYGEMHRFIPDYLSTFGAKMIEFDVEFKDRDFGVSAYSGSKRTIKVLLDIVTLAFLLNFARKPFRMMPGRLFGFTGAVITGLGGIGLMYLFILSVLMVIVGIQSIMMGLLGELMMRIYFESSDRKTYTIREKI
jgi:glycosyltransferase involved in cell wall biosynthesis